MFHVEPIIDGHRTYALSQVSPALPGSGTFEGANGEKKKVINFRRIIFSPYETPRCFRQSKPFGGHQLDHGVAHAGAASRRMRRRTCCPWTLFASRVGRRQSLNYRPVKPWLRSESNLTCPWIYFFALRCPVIGQGFAILMWGSRLEIKNKKSRWLFWIFFFLLV